MASFHSTSGRYGCDADQRGLHLAVAAPAELRTRNLESAWRWRDEFDDDRIATLRDADVDFQLRNRKAVNGVLRSNHEPDRLACRDVNRGRFEREPAGNDLDLVNGQVGGGRVMRHRHDGHADRSGQLLEASMHDRHATTT